MIGPLRSCLATNTESDRDCNTDSDADTDSGSSTAIFLHVGAHRAHEILLRESGPQVRSVRPDHKSASLTIEHILSSPDGRELGLTDRANFLYTVQTRQRLYMARACTGERAKSNGRRKTR